MDSIFVAKRRMWDGKRLLQLRQSKGISRESLGLTINIHPRTIENYERADNDPKRSVPDLDTAEDIADGLRTTVAYLACEIDDPAPDALTKLLRLKTKEENEKNEEEGAKNFRLRSGSGELADASLMKLLEERMATLDKLIHEKEKQTGSNSGSGEDSTKGH